MNRSSQRIVAVTLAFLLLAGASSFARDKKPKKKKEDLATNPLANVQSRQPDKELFDKAMTAMKKGRYDVARLDLQTMLNTYPDSEYRMRAKLALGDSWFREGGSAALTQAEAEYKDFETFFPNAPEAAEAQMKVGDIYYSEMEKPDRDFTNAVNAEKEYREMLNMYPDSTLLPRAKQKLRDVQEVLAERETQIGLYYEGKENYAASIARLQTVVETYPLYSKSDLALLTIGDAYAGQAKVVQNASGLPGAVKERMRSVYMDKAAKAYSQVITRYPSAPRVEDARDRLVAMNRPVPSPSEAAVAENTAEEESRQKLQITDKLWGLIKHNPATQEAVHVGDPSLEDPKRTLAPDVTKENIALFNSALAEGHPAPAPAVVPTSPDQPPRSDQPSQAPLQMSTPGATGVGVTVVNAPNSEQPATGATPAPAADPNALVKPVGSENTAIPAAQAPAAAPDQINDVKPGATPVAPNTVEDGKKKKAPKVDQSDESSSKKKKKKGLAKLNPF